MILCSGILVTPELLFLQAHVVYTRICRATLTGLSQWHPPDCELPIIRAGPLTSFLLLCCLWNYGYSKGSCRQRLSLLPACVWMQSRVYSVKCCVAVKSNLYVVDLLFSVFTCFILYVDILSNLLVSLSSTWQK